MRLEFKLLAAFGCIGLLVLGIFGIQIYYLGQPANTNVTNFNLDETFYQSSLLYGPQAWVPYASKLPVVPNVSVESNASFYIMLIDLNATSNLNATFPCVRVDYEFSGLHGTAAFHVYGYVKTIGGFSWTNRVEGTGASGFYVTVPPLSSNFLENAEPMPSNDNVYLKVSNKQGAVFNQFGNNTYLVEFAKSGGGLNSLHITTDPKNIKGNVTTTSNLKGTFYLDYSGSRIQDNFVLLVAINGTIGHDFSLNLKSSVPG